VALVEAMAIALESASPNAGPADVIAVAVAAQQHGMVALDDEGDPVWPAKLWNDTEAAPDAAELVSGHGGAAVWARACGSVPGPAFTVAKLAWLRRCHPAAHHRVRTVLLPHDWLTWRLTGSFVTDRGDASGTGYFAPIFWPRSASIRRYSPDCRNRSRPSASTEVRWSAVAPGTTWRRPSGSA
jgi:xylulokinase